MTLSLLDWSIIGAYVLVALAVGWAFSGRASRSTEEYFLSGRSLPWWVLGTSMVATTFAADTPLAITEFVRRQGIWRNWFWWNVALQGMVATFLFAPLWRRARVTTDQELTELRYGGRPAAFLRVTKAAYYAIFYNCLVLSWVIAGMTTVVSVLMDVNRQLAVLICILIALAYSVVSGFWGVVVTDLVQFLIAAGGSCLLAIMSVRHLGGMDALLSHLPTETLSFLPPAASTGAWTDAPQFQVFVYLTVVWWASQNVDGGGYIIQRMSAAKSEGHALAGTLWFNVCNYALRSWPWIIVALASLVVIPELSSHPFGDKAAYPLMIAHVLGPGARGLLVVSFLAAFMSTVDTHLNWGASYLVNDVYQRFIDPEAPPARCVRVAKVCVIVLAMLAAALSFLVDSISGLWEFVWALGCGLGPVLVLRWFWWRINAWSELTALLSSLGATLGLRLASALMPTWRLWGHPLGELPVHLKILTVLPVSLACWLVVTFLTAPEDDATLSTFRRRVNPGGWWGRFGSDDRDGPSPVLGVRSLWSFLAGAALVYGSTFSIGCLIFGRPRAAVLCGASAIAGTVLLLRLHRPEGTRETPGRAPAPSTGDRFPSPKA